MEKEENKAVKLHDLFKEYIENYWHDCKSADSLDYVVIDDWQAFIYWQRTYTYEVLISKKFGMIKWLVYNDKIDFRKIFLLDYGSKDILTDKLLMQLSIQDNPLEFLISILK